MAVIQKRCKTQAWVKIKQVKKYFLECMRSQLKKCSRENRYFLIVARTIFFHKIFSKTDLWQWSVAIKGVQKKIWQLEHVCQALQNMVLEKHNRKSRLGTALARYKLRGYSRIFKLSSGYVEYAIKRLRGCKKVI